MRHKCTRAFIDFYDYACTHKDACPLIPPSTLQGATAGPSLTVLGGTLVATVSGFASADLTVTGVHGNERTGIEVVRRLLAFVVAGGAYTFK